jgi:hypothetical protein
VFFTAPNGIWLLDTLEGDLKHLFGPQAELEQAMVEAVVSGQFGAKGNRLRHRTELLAALAFTIGLGLASRKFPGLFPAVWASTRAMRCGHRGGGAIHQVFGEIRPLRLAQP